MPSPTSPLFPDAVVPLEGLDRDQIAVAGGKGAQLGELTRIGGVSVPPGFVVTTGAYRRAMRHAPDAGAAVAVPDGVAAAIRRALTGFVSAGAVAVRSSATAEDLPSASSAGLHETTLGVVGPDAVIDAVGRCWSSLFTERAVAYRARHDIDERRVAMAVVVQEMVDADVSGVLFTADPVTSNRTVAAIEAVIGLGDALVAGTVNADSYRVRHGAIIEAAIAPGDAGPALTEAQVLELVELGRRIEAHFGSPQDIEWCLAGGRFWVVQSRPITTLFPIPARGCDRDRNRVYLSVGHQQMMTDAMKPLGLSLHQRVAVADMHEAGGRLFVEVTDQLASPQARSALVGLIGPSDPLTGDALRTLIDRPGFLPPPPDDAPRLPAIARAAGDALEPLAADPAIAARLVERDRASIAAMQREIATKTGADLFDFIDADIAELKLLLVDPDTMRALMAGIESARWLNERVEEWLGDKNVADTLSLSVPDNITSEMGLGLLDVADAIRPHAEVVEFLKQVDVDHVADGDFLDGMVTLAGGVEARAAIVAYLERYGMRCPGEIDITRPRWAERPAMLVPLILGNVRNTEPGEAMRRFERGRQAAGAKEREILARVRTLPGGELKAADTKAAIDRVRTFAGYREFPKYAMICRYFAYKQALLAEADRLVEAGVLDDREDCFYLTLDEFRSAVTNGQVDHALVAARREAHRWHRTLTPPRVLTSEGENVIGCYRRDGVPAGALVGLAVSTGTVEGRARVVVDMTGADLEPGDILVTTHTDPGWSPLFVAAAGLVTEVGGATSHGSVIAREYGLPAVVGVPGATTQIADGQRVRVHGADGYVELLAESTSHA